MRCFLCINLQLEATEQAAQTLANVTRSLTLLLLSTLLLLTVLLLSLSNLKLEAAERALIH
jgi:hypothetical protein